MNFVNFAFRLTGINNCILKNEKMLLKKVIEHMNKV